MMTLVPAKGAVLSIIPVSGQVAFQTDDEVWNLPLIGWAIVAHWTERGEDPNVIIYETDLDPVMLDERKYPVTMRTYMEDRDSAGMKIKYAVLVDQP